MLRAVLRLALLVLCLVAAAADAAKKGPRQSADRELRTRRNDCERDVCTGLVGETKLICAYKCVSEECYDEVYGKDTLEEGKVGTERGRQFSSCP
ncbi:hypothetical protein T484DRAFT_3273578 [Baffinella frigidus]|nr:hypothetical protein T484DRAFT_3273578 [Cryptophyta sp. CCMP2293]